MNKGGINVSKIYSSTIQSNFKDCDSDDTGEDDISCPDIYGSHIYNRHYRSTAPKTGASRVNLGRPFNLTAKTGFPISSLGGECSFSSGYNRSVVTNPNLARSLGGSYQTSFDYGSTLPSVTNRFGEFILAQGKGRYSDGTKWVDLSGDLTNLASSTDLHALNASARYYAAEISAHTNIPAGATGPAMIEINFISTGYLIIELTLLKTSGGIYSQRLNNSVWDAWVKIA